MAQPVVDTTFDVRTDSGGGDPDRHSATLRAYHRWLWSKPLPSGATFDLDARLHHKSDRGEFWLSSDSIAHTYSGWSRPRRLVEVITTLPLEERTAFFDLACTVGAFLVFPVSTYVDGKLQRSINQARGLHPMIRDRFDFTLECIRRHYAGTTSPLSTVLTAHADFLDLFEDFPGYVKHFLLDDLVDSDASSVLFFGDFDDFSTNPLPMATADDYRVYMSRSMAFIRRRNDRIAAYSAGIDQ